MRKTAIQVVDEMLRTEHSKPAQGETDWAYRRALRDVIERLKKEPLEEPEKAAVLDFLDRLHVIGDWLVEETGEHNCAGGGSEVSGAHEPGCGYEPITPLAEIRIETR